MIKELKDRGNDLFKNNEYGNALKNYEHALKISHAHGFEDNAVKLHSNVAAVFIKLGNYKAADEHAAQCIQLDSSFPKVCEILYIHYFSF